MGVIRICFPTLLSVFLSYFCTYPSTKMSSPGALNSFAVIFVHIVFQIDVSRRGQVLEIPVPPFCQC